MTLVVGDSKQPGAQRRIAAETVDCAEGPKQRFLGRVSCVVRVLQVRKTAAMYSLDMLSDELAEQRFPASLTGLYPYDQTLLLGTLQGIFWVLFVHLIAPVRE